MNPGRRAFFGHALAFPAGVLVGFAAARLGAALMVGRAIEGAAAGAMVGALGLGAALLGFVAYSLVLARALKLRLDAKWWGLGAGVVIATQIAVFAVMVLGFFAPVEGVILWLFLLFALGGWAAQKRLEQDRP